MAPGRGSLGKRDRSRIPVGSHKPSVVFGFRSPGRGDQSSSKVSGRRIPVLYSG